MDWKLSKVYEDRIINVCGERNNLSISFGSEKYSVIQCQCVIKNMICNNFYRFDADVEGDCECRFYFIFYDKNGKEFSKGYLIAGKQFLVPLEAENFVLEVLSFSEGIGELRINNIQFSRVSEYIPRKVRICSISYSMIGGPELKPYSENVENVMKEIDIVSKEKPDLIVLTECVFQTRELRINVKATYDTLDNGAVKRLCEKAKKYHTYIVCSIKEKDKEGIIHNTGLLISRNGEIEGTYRKTHLTVGELAEGIPYENDMPVFETDFGRIAIQICWDHFFPEYTRILAMKGAEIIVIPTHGFERERAVMRAADNGIYIVTSYTYFNGTVIVNPVGTIVADAEKNGYAFYEIDLNMPIYDPALSCESNAIPKNIYFNERRNDLYDQLKNR